MDPLRLVEFDVLGTNPLNKFVGELIKLTDKTLTWVIPNGAPFFGEYPLTRVYNEKGAELTLGRDWFMEGEFTPFCKVTGRRIVSFIRLSQQVVDTNAFVKVNYQSTGAWFVPRNSLEEWLEAIYRKGDLIPWSKVYNVPPTLPAAFHMHSASKEIGDWYELTFFFTYLTGVAKATRSNADVDVKTTIDRAYAKLEEARDLYLQQIVDHDGNYFNPHGINAKDLVLGNHPNWATATVDEDKAGVRNDVLSTPLGIQELAKEYSPDTSEAMRAGILPISRFAGDSFIPPVIDGSFEGLGSLTDSSGICLEPNGVVMIISNHYDGRTEGLYYSTLTNYNKNNSQLRYTSFKYDPPSLKSQGVTVNRIVCGSGHKVIMTGVDGTPDWFLALTNGTFDPAGHSYSKCDMSAVIALKANAINEIATTMMVHLMGDYIVLVVGYTYTVFDDRYAIFRVRADDVRQGLPVKWERMKLTFDDYDNNRYTSQDYFTTAKATKDSAGKITQFGCWDFPTAINRAGHNGRRAGTWSAPHKTDKAQFYLQLVIFPTFFLDSGIGNISASDLMNMCWSLNPATGVMTKVAQSPRTTFDFGPNPVVQPGSMASLRLDIFNNAVSVSPACSSVFLPSGEMIQVYTTSGNLFPTWTRTVKWKGFTSDVDILSNGLEKARIGLPTFNRAIQHEKIAPIPSGSYPAGVCYEADGDLYGAVEPGLNTRAIFFRKVTGGYEVREGITNLNVDKVYARPLSNNIFKTNLLHEDIMINVTGDATRLANGGVECGSLSFSAGAYSNQYGNANAYLPSNGQLKKAGGVLVTFPRTYSRTLDLAARTAVYKGETFYGFRQNIIDKVKQLLPPEHVNTKWWSFTFYMLNAENGGMFKGLNFGIIQIHYMHATTGEPFVITLTVTPVIEAPDANHPDVYLIANFKIIFQTAPFRTGNGSLMNGTSTQGFGRNGNTFRQRPMLQIYNDGVKLQVYIVGSWFARTTSTYHAKLCSTFDIPLASLSIENKYAGAIGWDHGELVSMIPKEGPTDVSKGGSSPTTITLSPPNPNAYAYTGGAALLCKKAVNGVDKFFLTCTAYAETGWVVYLQDGIPMMLNGTMYSVPGGTIDLRDIDPNPKNKTYWLYATVENATPRYIISATKLRESGSLLLAAKLVTNEKQILTITRFQPFVIGDYKLSYTREGGTIPLSSGFPQDEGKFAFVRNSELLP